ncbi:hypothetical protein ACPVPU_13130 [Sphingomonas sp. CJ99]
MALEMSAVWVFAERADIGGRRFNTDRQRICQRKRAKLSGFANIGGDPFLVPGQGGHIGDLPDIFEGGSIGMGMMAGCLIPAKGGRWLHETGLSKQWMDQPFSGLFG